MTIWIGAAAVVGGAVIGAVGSNKAAGKAASGAEAAGDMQLEAAKLTIAEQKRQFDLTQERMQPWIDRGNRAGDKMESILYGPAPSKYAKFVGSRGRPQGPAVPKSGTRFTDRFGTGFAPNQRRLSGRPRRYEEER